MIFLYSSKVVKNQMIKPLLSGFLVSVIASLIITVICAVAATNLSVSDDGLLIMSLICMSLGAFFGGMAAAKIYKEKGFLIGALNGVIFFFLTTVISFALNADTMTYISLIKFIIFTLSSMIGGVIGVNMKRKRSF